MTDREKLGMLLSEAVLQLTGFGPSRIVSEQCAHMILSEAQIFGVTLNLDAPGRPAVADT